MALIEVDNVTKIYRSRGVPRTLFTGGNLANLLRGRRGEDVVALRNVSFEVEPGECVGIIGANGSGKSTLVKILAGVTVPTSGHVTLRGRVASLLELGAGFHPLLTGRENIYLNARILGLSRADIERVFDDIVEFSGVGEFLDNPVSTYSSGMFVRLGFAVAAHTNPDVFLVDEVLSVGDEEFQRKCRKRIGEFREQGRTLVFVSHDLGIVNTLCSRVMLLARGEMVVRDSARATIDYYLRQVGQSSAVHTLTQETVEAVFCQGRLSLFRDRTEITAPSGGRMRFLSMGQWHDSMAADWTVDERHADACRASGRMARLPVVLHWTLGIDNGVLRWTASMRCTQPVELSAVRVELDFPAAYTRYLYGGITGDFPAIIPEDQDWIHCVRLMPDCRSAGALPGEGGNLPPVFISLEQARGGMQMEWTNSDYITSCRKLALSVSTPQGTGPMEAGLHELFSITIDLTVSAKDAEGRFQAAAEQHVIESGPLVAVFDGSYLRLLWDSVEVTTGLHVYTSMLINGLWHDSQQFHWLPPRRDGGRLTLVAESRRYPFAQTWEIEPAATGLVLRIWIDAREAVTFQEYHVSVLLRPQYARWTAGRESGVFPEFDGAQTDWTHLDRVHETASFARADGEGVPSVTLRPTAHADQFGMTVLNTTIHEHARVLQALRTPEKGLLHLEPGRHLYFEGNIETGAER